MAESKLEENQALLKEQTTIMKQRMSEVGINLSVHIVNDLRKVRTIAMYSRGIYFEMVIKCNLNT